MYEANKDDFTWTEERQKAFDTLKQKLLETPALGLPDVNKPFYLFMDEHTGIAKRCSSRQWDQGSTQWPACPKVNLVAAAWPPCVRIIATVALLVKDADKLTLGQNPTIATHHTLEGILKQPPDR